jgi:hypothetical protein
MTEVASRFSAHELEVIKAIECARNFQEMTQTPGWKQFLELRDERLNAVKAQLFGATVNKDLLWDMQIRLKGIQDFLDVLFGGVETAVDSLDPKVIHSFLTPASELEGELDLEPLPDEG